MYEKTTRSWLKHLDFILLDMISIGICFAIAYRIRDSIDGFMGGVAYRNICWPFMAFIF